MTFNNNWIGAGCGSPAGFYLNPPNRDSMSQASFNWFIEGFEGQFTEYTFGVLEPEYDPSDGTISVGVESERFGNSANVDSATATLFVDGEEVGSDSGSPSGFGGVWATPSGTVEITDPVEVTVEVTTDQFGGHSGSGSFTFTPPEPPFSPGAVSVSCSVDADEVMVGEHVDVEATVTNDNAQAAEVTLTYTFGDTETTESVVVSGESVFDQTVTFEPEDGDPDGVEYDVGVDLSAQEA